MAMPEAICPVCGAINQLRTDTCWRCLGAMDEQPTWVETPAAPPGDRHRVASEIG